MRSCTARRLWSRFRRRGFRKNWSRHCQIHTFKIVAASDSDILAGSDNAAGRSSDLNLINSCAQSILDSKRILPLPIRCCCRDSGAIDSVDQLHLSIGDCWFTEADFAVVIKVAVDGAGDCRFEYSGSPDPARRIPEAQTESSAHCPRLQYPLLKTDRKTGISVLNRYPFPEPDLD